jgi:4-amino-4-deoxy-L-arabinose transferase-like glycosyltransferase
MAPINLPSFDTYYYWDWSRHLDLSYYDGSPMIAYFIKASTLLFGDTLFALTFVGTLSTALTSWIIYKTARHFLSPSASYVAMSLWLFSPLVTIDQLQQTTYDTPLTLFWALTLYYVIRFLKYETRNDLYFIGLSIGLMLLSKYSGVVLIGSLLIFLITTRYRYLFKTHQFYLALLIAIACFSPVIIWNYQHEWRSFIYQLTTHQHTTQINPITTALHSWFYNFLPSLNVMLLPPLICWINIKASNHQKMEDDKTASMVKLCRIICFVFMSFYLFTACKADIRSSWLSPYLITSALLAGYCYQKFNYKKSINMTIIGYAFASCLIILNNSYLYHIVPSNKLDFYRLMQQFNEKYKKLPNVVFSSGWFEARMLFFVKDKPLIYTINCGANQNQYALWSSDIMKKIANKTVPEILFIDDQDREGCLEKYFDKCEHLPTQSIKTAKEIKSIYAYKCINYKTNNTSIN